MDLEALLVRAAALEQEALAAMTPPIVADAVPYFFHAQEAFPYWTNRLSSISAEDGAGADDDFGEEYERYSYEIIMRLAVGHVTDGVRSEYERTLGRIIPQVMSYFNARELLQSQAYPTAPDDVVRARIVACTGVDVLPISEHTQVIGTEFTLRVETVEYSDQAYH